MSSYRDAERLRQATWIVKHPMDYTDAEVRRAGRIKAEMEGRLEAQRVADAETVEANRRVRAVRECDAELAALQAEDAWRVAEFQQAAYAEHAGAAVSSARRRERFSLHRAIGEALGGGEEVA